MPTHDFLTQMLGVRRTSVTEVANTIEAMGVIICSRRVIKIIDLEVVKALSRECYQTVREQASAI